MHAPLVTSPPAEETCFGAELAPPRRSIHFNISTLPTKVCLSLFAIFFLFLFQEPQTLSKQFPTPAYQSHPSSTMDFINKLSGGNNANNKQPGGEASNNNNNNSNSSGGFMDKVNNMAGGGQQGEANEDGLDKGSLPVFPLSS